MTAADNDRMDHARPEPFDLTGSPLAGTNLIEAGAGTGKTYAIAGLYIRLLIEKSIPVRDILVVTYTIAATEELRDRIRRRIRETLYAFRAGNGPDPFLDTLLRKFPLPEERNQAAERLTEAIRDFDEAAIYTIHGFCQRILQENAFASGSLFDTELITDDQEIRREIVEDFWRIHFYESIPEVMAYAREQKYGPDSLLKLAQGHAIHPDVLILPEIAPPDRDALQRLISDLNGELSRLKELWCSSREVVGERLCNPALKVNIYGESRVRVWIAEMDRYLTADRPSFPLCDGFDKFTTGRIASAVKKDQRPPEHPVFEICTRIMDLAGRLKTDLDRYLLYLKKELLRKMQTELPGRKQKRNVFSFDDLLLRLRQALMKPEGEALASVIRRKYRAALIDEFQDTDPVQYAIFAKVFRAEGSILFLIGDPKQAIYSFRGADIFAYLKAASQVDNVYTLDANWRSDPVLIKAVNTLFSRRGNPFVFEKIAFRKATPGSTVSRGQLLIDGRLEPPLQWWFVTAGRYADGDKPLAKGIARPLIAGSVAAEIARLLRLGREGRAMLGEKPLQEGDIAILVRTNREAQLCQELLSELRIPAVLHSIGNLFDSQEALETERVLTAILTPDREDLLRAAMATAMIGCDLAALEALQRDEPTWEAWRERFRSYHEQWRKDGFLTMFRTLLDREQVRPRLLSYPDGERRLTNLIHLSEVLNREAGERKLGMRALLKWLAERRDSASLRDEEHQLRLESDSLAVRIVTIHKSKGLEYPVVFCPFSWGDLSESDVIISYHDPVSHAQVYDLGSDAIAGHRAPARKERLAEEVRLLYVALTRARDRCTFVWGRMNEAGMSAQAYLFHGDDREEDVVAATEARFRELSDGEMFQELEAIVGKADGAIALCELPTEAEPAATGIQGEGAELLCRTFTGAIDRSWRVASFSLLTSGLIRNSELPDHDDEHKADPTPPESEPAREESEAIFSFPGGRRSGTLLHDILEKWDFREKNETLLTDLIAAKLRENGFEEKWGGTIREMIRRVVSHPLTRNFTATEIQQTGPADILQGCFSQESVLSVEPGAIFLSNIGAGERLSELEFYFPLQPISREKLTGLFREAGIAGHVDRYTAQESSGAEKVPDPGKFAESLKRFRFDPVRGFLKGFIDMVFRHDGRYYLVDWKSNFLGCRKEDYHCDRLAVAMTEHDYILQYHLYVLALHRYLLFRQPGYNYHSHFGGVYYLFLRGMNPAWGADYGVYRDRPSAELVELLCREMIGAV